ncbi:hypothetical protein ACIPZ5_00360, partial [Pseudomonas sp. NPDC089428]|uniref:hypothetical protein n=1 Tax=Pseudomonas sp. NPDC089428 TaxID=3364467 RepID=UPI0037FCC79B
MGPLDHRASVVPGKSDVVKPSAWPIYANAERQKGAQVPLFGAWAPLHVTAPAQPVNIRMLTNSGFAPSVSVCPAAAIFTVGISRIQTDSY